MKRIFTLLLLAFLGSHIVAEELNINGTIVDEGGNAVAGHAVYVSSMDSTAGFFYNNTIYTNEAGVFSDVVEIGDITQGQILASTQSCNEMITASAFFNPGNYDLTFSFEVCTDTTGGGGNDTIVEGCENYFYYYQGEGLQVFFFGGVEQEGDVIFSWNYGDGTTGDGMETEHTYTEEGSYEVSLYTLLNDTCEFISYQTIYIVDDSTGGGNDSTYCYNDFSFMVNDFTVSFEGWVANDGVVESLNWDFGDGSSAEGISVEHTFAEAGIYDVTFTTEYVNGDSICIAATTKSIFIEEDPIGDFLYGTVKRGEALLDFGMVQIFSIVNDTISGDNDIILYDETAVDSAGMYYFWNIPTGNYLILAQATQQSIYFNQTVPTYYGDVIHWADATILNLGDPMNPYDINLTITGQTSQGDGEINGGVVGEGFKSQLIEENIIVLLLDENNNALSFTLSELDSDFDFSELAYGTYIVYAEVVGITTEPGMVTLSVENPTANIDVVITPNGVTTGLNELDHVQISGNIYPNPVGSSARMNLNILKDSHVELVLLNQMGQVLESKSEYMTQGINKVELNTELYPSGVYFIQINSEITTITQKFIKK